MFGEKARSVEQAIEFARQRRAVERAAERAEAAGSLHAATRSAILFSVHNTVISVCVSFVSKNRMRACNCLYHRAAVIKEKGWAELDMAVEKIASDHRIPLLLSQHGQGAGYK